MRFEAFFICSRGAYTIFHHTLAESTTFAPGSETQMWYFRPGYDEKSYTQHGGKEGHPRAHICHPRLQLGWQFTRVLDWTTLHRDTITMIPPTVLVDTGYYIPVLKLLCLHATKTTLQILRNWYITIHA